MQKSKSNNPLLQKVKERHGKKDREERESMYRAIWDIVFDGRKSIEKQMQINTSFQVGNQWIGWNSDRAVVQTLKAPANRIRVTDNKIAPKIRSKVSRQMGFPAMQVLPESMDELDIKRARIKERLVEHIFRENNMVNVQLEMSLWASVCGDAYPYVTWDSKMGALYEDDGEMYGEGDVKIGVMTPWEVWEDLNARSGQFGRFVFTGRLFPLHHIEDEFGDDLAKAGIDSLVADGEEHTNKEAYQAMRSFYSQASKQSTAEEGEDQILLKTGYIFPSKQDPVGKRVVLLNNRIVQEGPLDWFPLIHYTNMHYLGRHRGDTELRHAIPLQKAWNRHFSSVEEYLRTMVKGKWMVNKNSPVSSSSPNSEHAEVVEWTGQVPPQQARIEGLPPDIYRQREEIKASIDDVFANRPASQGRSGAQQPGVAIQLLQQEDDQEHLPTVSLFERAIREIAERALMLASRKYKHGRKITVIGDDMKAEIDEIERKGELGGEEDMLGGTHRVYVAIGASLPKSKAAREQIVQARYNLGWYGNPADPSTAKKALRMVDAGVVEDVYDRDKRHEQAAKRENEKMSQGEMVVINDWDMHDVHAEIHEHDLTSEEHENSDPKIREIREDHYKQHLMLLMAAQAPPEDGADQNETGAISENALGALPPAGDDADSLGQSAELEGVGV